jgi:hypothetical protein
MLHKVACSPQQMLPLLIVALPGSLRRPYWECKFHENCLLANLLAKREEIVGTSSSCQTRGVGRCPLLLLLLDGCEKIAGESKLSATPRGRLAYS